MPEVIVTIFEKDIQKNIFPDNQFHKRSKKDKGIVDTASTVEIPQAGAKPTGGKNPSSFPLTIKQREDDKKSYDVDLYYTDPFHVEDNNQAIVSYDKRKDILEDHILYLNTSFANDIAQIWCPTESANIIRTSGEAKTATLPGATGTRLMLVLEDFINADRVMNRMDVPKEGRCCLMSADTYADLLIAGIKGFVGVDKLSADLIAKGVVGKILNFEIYVRSSVSRYTNDGTPTKKAVGAVEAAADNDVTLFWHELFVRSGEGKVKVYYNPDKAEYLGSIMNAKVRGGGCIPRADQVGVVALVQAHGA